MKKKKICSDKIKPLRHYCFINFKTCQIIDTEQYLIISLILIINKNIFDASNYR